MATRKVTILIGLTLVLLAACGTAEAPEPTTAPAAEEPTSSPVMSETSQPTDEPQSVDSPADVEVHPGKVTWMVADLGNERFDQAIAAGAGGAVNYGRIIGGGRRQWGSVANNGLVG
jgi:hypothetical protein